MTATSAAPNPPSTPAQAAKPSAAGVARPAHAAPEDPADQPSIGKLVADASTHVSTLVHGEIELAKLELRSSVKNAGVGVGLFAAAAVLLVFSLIYGFQALAEGLNQLGLDRWLAFLVVFAGLLVLAGLLVYLGIRKVKRVRAPARTIKTTKETVDYLKNSRG
ncbi:phage holin family protein [uncultured Jatrophihabitans sp.]|uniref:phage holin family protein n=1 Tax=uncultured Jatrophihabitans sp. TaxID=1610747 RepID=UPI0035CB17F2